jgi:hypothetical protein
LAVNLFLFSFLFGSPICFPCILSWFNDTHWNETKNGAERPKWPSHSESLQDERKMVIDFHQIASIMKLVIYFTLPNKQTRAMQLHSSRIL